MPVPTFVRRNGLIGATLVLAALSLTGCAADSAQLQTEITRLDQKIDTVENRLRRIESMVAKAGKGKAKAGKGKARGKAKARPGGGGGPGAGGGGGGLE